MFSGGYLRRPSESGEQSEQQKRLWNDTSDRLQKFLPNLMPELFPEPEVKEEKQTKTEGAPNRVEESAPLPAAETRAPESA